MCGQFWNFLWRRRGRFRVGSNRIPRKDDEKISVDRGTSHKLGLVHTFVASLSGGRVRTTVCANLGTPGVIFTYKEQCKNFIGGKWTPSTDEQHTDSSTPVTGGVFCRVPQSNERGTELTPDAIHKAKGSWTSVPAAEWALILHRIANRLEENLEKIIVVETWENGKAIHGTLAAGIPLTIDRFRYFADATRTQEGHVS